MALTFAVLNLNLIINRREYTYRRATRYIDEINQVSYQNHKKKIFNYRHNIDIFS